MSPDLTEIHSDSVPKIYPIGSDGFIGTAGFKMAAEFQQRRAPELARELGTADIEAIGEALARESLFFMRELISTLSSALSFSAPGSCENIRRAVSGESVLHACALAGRNSQKDAGYVILVFQVAVGRIVCKKTAHFGRERRINSFFGGPSLEYIQTLGQKVRDLPPISAVRLILRDIESESAMSGGPDQIAIVNSEGARWVDRPPAQNEAPPSSGATTWHAETNIPSSYSALPSSIPVSASNLRFLQAGTITASIEISAATSISCEGAVSCISFTCSGLDIDESGNLSATSVVASGSLGGHDVTCGNSLTVDTSSVTVNGHAGVTTTFQDKAGNTHDVVGGIITS